MSFIVLADALKHVNLDAISEIELVRLIRLACNKDLTSDHNNYVGLALGMIIAKSLKSAYNKGYWDATNFIAGS